MFWIGLGCGTVLGIVLALVAVWAFICLGTSALAEGFNPDPM